MRELLAWLWKWRRWPKRHKDASLCVYPPLCIEEYPDLYASSKLCGCGEKRGTCRYCAASVYEIGPDRTLRYAGRAGPMPAASSKTRPPFDRPDSRTREDREEARREHLEAHG